MEDADVYAISVEVAPRFLDDQSAPEDGRYAFAYTIRIHNQGRVAARLVARHWRITDANGRVEHVDGDGVIGEQPRLRPGEDFHYTSGVMLRPDLSPKQSARRAARARRAEADRTESYWLRWFSALIRPSMPFWLICWANWLR